MSVCNKVFLLLTVTLFCWRDCMGCFPMEDLFQMNHIWRQQAALFNYTEMIVGNEADDLMELRYYQGNAWRQTVRMRCLIAYAEHRYLVRIEKETEEDSTHSCIQFELLTYTVLQMSQTGSDEIRKKVNCIDDAYVEDPAVFFANSTYFGVNCPLVGGYQLLMDTDNKALPANCLDSIYTYNPRIQFQCDNAKSGNVILELGEACEFKALVDKVQVTKRNIVPLRCMASWNQETTSFLLLQMLENENHVMCLQFKKASSRDGLTPVYLSLDGRCPKHDFGSDNMRNLYTAYGALSSYASPTDPKCLNSTAAQSDCGSSDECFRSNKCPSQCNRCIKEERFSPCQFDLIFQGRWRPLSEQLSYIDIVVDATFMSGYYGNFTCREVTDSQGQNTTQYSLIRVGSVPSCMPFYACVTMKHLSPGMLFFQFRSVIRDQESGKPFSCADSNDKWGHLNQLNTEEPLTIFDSTKLVRTGCNIPSVTYFRTIHQNCRIILNKCTGSCTTLNISLDPATCSNDTRDEYPLLTSHVCLGSIQFFDKVVGVLTTNPKTSLHFCWVNTGIRLFVATPEECNQKSVSLILNDEEALRSYDPLTVLADPEFEVDEASKILFSIPLLVIQWFLYVYIF